MLGLIAVLFLSEIWLYPTRQLRILNYNIVRRDRVGAIKQRSGGAKQWCGHSHTQLDLV